MKLFLLVSLLSFTSISFACDPSQQEYLCAGDEVIAQNGFVGKVLGVNVRKGEAAVKWHTNPSGYSRNIRGTQNIKDLSIGRGCLGYHCVGDTVASNDGFVGKIIGVNPYNSKAAVRWRTTPTGYSRDFRSTVSVRDLSLHLGCVNGLCIDDTVASSDGFVGKVIGVNPYNSKATVRWHTSPAGYSRDLRSTESIDELYVEKFCDLYGPSALQRNISISIELRGRFIVEDFELRFARKH